MVSKIIALSLFSLTVVHSGGEELNTITQCNTTMFSLCFSTGIQPKNKDWIPNDCTRFQDLTVGKCFAAKTINFEPDDQKYTLEVLLVDVSTNEDIFMHKLLINEGRAIPK